MTRALPFLCLLASGCSQAFAMPLGGDPVIGGQKGGLLGGSPAVGAAEASDDGCAWTPIDWASISVGGTLQFAYDAGDMDGAGDCNAAWSDAAAVGASGSEWTAADGAITGDTMAQGTASKRPTYVDSCAGTYPCVRFDGSDDRLQSDAAESNYRFISTDLATIYLLFSPEESGGNSIAVGTLTVGSGVWWALFHHDSGGEDAPRLASVSGASSNCNITGDSTELPQDTISLFASTLKDSAAAGTECEVFVDGTSEGTGDRTASTSDAALEATLRFGGGNAGVNDMQMDLIAVAAWSGDRHDGTEQAAVLAAIEAAVGTLPIAH